MGKYKARISKFYKCKNSHSTRPNWTLKNACVVDVSIFFDELRRSQAPGPLPGRPVCLPNTPPTMYMHVVGVIRKNVLYNI